MAAPAPSNATPWLPECAGLQAADFSQSQAQLFDVTSSSWWHSLWPSVIPGLVLGGLAACGFLFLLVWVSSCAYLRAACGAALACLLWVTPSVESRQAVPTPTAAAVVLRAVLEAAAAQDQAADGCGGAGGAAVHQRRTGCAGRMERTSEQPFSALLVAVLLVLLAGRSTHPSSGARHA